MLGHTPGAQPGRRRAVSYGTSSEQQALSELQPCRSIYSGGLEHGREVIRRGHVALLANPSKRLGV